MANVERGEVGVMVDGKSYTLRPTFDSLCELESLMNLSIDDIMVTIQQGRRSGLRAIVWCLLQDVHADEFKVLKDASRWIERVGSVERVLELVNQVFAANDEPIPEGGAANPQTAQAGTGERSSSALVGSA